MGKFNELLQRADWKSEKHVPVIEVLEKGKKVKVRVSVGKEIAHPNKTEHHIVWIEVYFKGEGSKFPYMIGKADFAAHGASTEGPDTSTVYTEPDATLTFKTERSGTIYAFSYCNIHGLWVNEEELGI
jgi:superoxide reductase